MITIFNRKEVVCTFNMQRQADARSILAANNIKYVLKVNDNSIRGLGGGALANSPFGEIPNVSVEYRIFVHKKDYEQAKYLLR